MFYVVVAGLAIVGYQCGGDVASLTMANITGADTVADAAVLCAGALLIGTSLLKILAPYARNHTSETVLALVSSSVLLYLWYDGTVSLSSMDVNTPLQCGVVWASVLVLW